MPERKTQPNGFQSKSTQNSEQYKGREILDIEYEIPDTSALLQGYYNVLWDPQFHRDGITSPEEGYRKFTHEVIPNHIRNEGVVVDVASGSSSVIEKLNEIAKQHGRDTIFGVMVDLQSNFLKEKESPAIAADALQLPFKDCVAQLILSRGLLLYLIEHRDSDSFRRFIDLQKQQIDIQKRTREFPALLLNENIINEFNALSTAIDTLSIKGQTQYDLKLVEMHVSEIGRVLKKEGEARIEPLIMHALFKLNHPTYNKERLNQLTRILTSNFPYIHYYEQPSYRGEHQAGDRGEQEVAIRQFQRIIQTMPKKQRRAVDRIFEPEKWDELRGVLVLKK